MASFREIKTYLFLFFITLALRTQAFAENNADFVSQTVPTVMTAGQSYSVTVNMKNTGITPWTPGTYHRLGSQDPQDNNLWLGSNRVSLATGETINPGQTKSFTFTVKAPATPGAYSFRWRMVQDGVEWFGASTPATTVTVTPVAPTGLQPNGTVFGPTTTSVTLSWNPVPGATSYAVRSNDLTEPALRDPRNNCVNSPHYMCIDGVTSTSLTLPVKPGHSYSWWVHAFSNLNGPPASAGFSIAKNNADFVSQTVPTVMTAGQSYSVTVNMKNTGTTPWTPGTSHRLGSQDPQDNKLWLGSSRVYLSAGETINPGQTKSFTFTVKAPATPGAYSFRWRMVQDGVEWFGAYTPATTVTVTPVAPTGLQPNGTVFGRTTTSVTLSWNPVPGATSYAVRSNDLTEPALRDPRNNCVNSPHYMCIDGVTATNLTLPVKPGHSYSWWVHAFSNLNGPPASAGFSVPGNNAEFVSQTLPGTITGGKQYPVSITMKNTGATAWTRAGGIRLAVQPAQTNIALVINNRVDLATTDSIAPGQAKTFSFSILAPAVPDRYDVKFIMASPGEPGGFGAASPAQTLVVRLPAPTGLLPSGHIFPETTTTVSLTWDEVSGANFYDLVVQDLSDPAARDPRNNCASSTDYVCLESLTDRPATVAVRAGHAYRWTVRGESRPVPGRKYIIPKIPKVLPGTYATKADFSVRSGTPPIVPPVEGNAAEVVSINAPASMKAGNSYDVSVTVKNTGTSAWSAAKLYRLGSENPRDNTFWSGRNRIELAAGETVPSGQQKRFDFKVTPPAVPGTYYFQWRMVQDGVEWFGAASPAVAVTVTASKTNSGSALTANTPWTTVDPQFSCNSVSPAQVPGQPDLFVLRTINGPCANPEGWSLALGRMDWSNFTLKYERPLLSPTNARPIALSDGRGLTSAYDASVAYYNGEYWAAFECWGNGFEGAAGACLGPLNLTGGIDPQRTYVAVTGNAYAEDGYNYSASVPKLLNHQGALYLYWSVLKIDKAKSGGPKGWFALNSTSRGVLLKQETGGLKRLWANTKTGPIAANDPVSVEVMGPGAAPRSDTAADIYQVFSDGLYVYATAARGGSGGSTTGGAYEMDRTDYCVGPKGTSEGCYRATISRSLSPLGYRIFNGETVDNKLLPSNPHDYSRIVFRPDGAPVLMMGNAHAPSPAQTNAQTIPNGRWIIPIPSSTEFFFSASPRPAMASLGQPSEPEAVPLGAGLRVYPNPLRLSEGDAELHIENASPNATVTLSTITGRRVTSFLTDGIGQAAWNPRSNARSLSTGIYVGVISGPEGVQRFRLVVIR